MKKSLLLTLTLATGVSVLIVACTQNTSVKETAGTTDSTATMVARGEYLVNAVGCDDCHSPKQMGPHGPEVIAEKRLSGYPADRPIQKADTNTVKQGWALFGPDLTSTVGPWGMSFAANISSDSTGIGNWKEEQFIRAIREGKSKGLAENRSLLPPMPWPMYRNFTDYDLKSIFAYLKTVKPVKNVVPQPISFGNL